MSDKYEIVIVGYRWYWQTLQRTIESILSTNERNWPISIGLNSPEPDMLAIVAKYRKHLNHIEISNTNLNKVGMQRRLVRLASAKYIVSFDHDSYVIDEDWQVLLIERIEAYENRTLRFYGDFGEAREKMFRRMTNNTVGILGRIYCNWFNEDERTILSRCPWYDPINKIKHETLIPANMKEMISYCAGSFYVFLREPYIQFDFPGFDYKMLHEDVILSYFFQHHGYRLGDLVSGFMAANATVLGNRLILNHGPRTFDARTVEATEHSLSIMRSYQSYNQRPLVHGRRGTLRTRNPR